MTKVGVRELKNRLSDYLRRVARGEHIQVTVRGKPIAELVPAGRVTGEDPELLRLEAEGKLTLSRAAKDRHPPTPVKTRGSASAHILEEREADR